MASFHKIGNKLLRVTGFDNKNPVTHEFKLVDGTPVHIEVSSDDKTITIKKILDNGTTEPILVLLSE